MGIERRGSFGIESAAFAVVLLVCLAARLYSRNDGSAETAWSSSGYIVNLSFQTLSRGAMRAGAVASYAALPSVRLGGACPAPENCVGTPNPHVGDAASLAIFVEAAGADRRGWTPVVRGTGGVAFGSIVDRPGGGAKVPFVVPSVGIAGELRRHWIGFGAAASVMPSLQGGGRYPVLASVYVATDVLARR
jgi:hypothetical protein